MSYELPPEASLNPKLVISDLVIGDKHSNP